MSDELRLWIGIFSVVISAAAYLYYMVITYRGHVKPHLFSWAVWAILLWIVFFAQASKGAGAGAWVTAASALFSTIITFQAYLYGEKNITKSDWIALIGALTTIPVWYMTRDPLWVEIIACVIDAFACYPTARKSYYKPYEESAIMFTVDIVKWVFGILAMTTFSAVTLTYPIYAFVANGIILAIIVGQRLKANGLKRA